MISKDEMLQILKELDIQLSPKLYALSSSIDEVRYSVSDGIKKRLNELHEEMMNSIKSHAEEVNLLLKTYYDSNILVLQNQIMGLQKIVDDLSNKKKISIKRNSGEKNDQHDTE